MEENVDKLDHQNLKILCFHDMTKKNNPQTGETIGDSYGL
jgi:hypothetical protein